jgi:AhpD family alkylhydroperoxidase
MDTMTLQARIANPALAVPDAIEALQAMNKAISRARISQRTLELMHLRASQINGCAVCAVQHPKIARKLGETDDRIFAVAAWRDAPFFTDAERAALALAESVTLAALVLAIATVNVWNRLNVATRQVAGQEW